MRNNWRNGEKYKASAIFKACESLTFSEYTYYMMFCRKKLGYVKYILAHDNREWSTTHMVKMEYSSVQSFLQDT